jgi:hypothetical protein
MVDTVASHDGKGMTAAELQRALSGTLPPILSSATSPTRGPAVALTTSATAASVATEATDTIAGHGLGGDGAAAAVAAPAAARHTNFEGTNFEGTVGLPRLQQADSGEVGSGDPEPTRSFFLTGSGSDLDEDEAEGESSSCNGDYNYMHLPPFTTEVSAAVRTMQ